MVARIRCMIIKIVRFVRCSFRCGVRVCFFLCIFFLIYTSRNVLCTWSLYLYKYSNININSREKDNHWATSWVGFTEEHHQQYRSGDLRRLWNNDLFTKTKRDQPIVIGGKSWGIILAVWSFRERIWLFMSLVIPGLLIQKYMLLYYRATTVSFTCHVSDGKNVRSFPVVQPFWKRRYLWRVKDNLAVTHASDNNNRLYVTHRTGVTAWR